MSTETLRVCDHCKEPVKDGEELWTVGVVAVCNAQVSTPFPRVFNMHQRQTNNNRLLKDHFMDMCRPCMTERGLVVAPNEEPEKEPETLDSLLNDIIDERVQEYLDGER